MLRVACIVMSASVLVGCAAGQDRVSYGAEHMSVSNPKAPASKVACPYRIGEIRDRREADDAGATAGHSFAVADIDDALRARLVESGLGTQSETTAPAVAIDVRHLYVEDMNQVSLGVAVLQASIDHGPGFVVRAQMDYMNLQADASGIQGALRQTLQAASDQLVARLNARCAISALPARAR